jgi:polar amino acid transport system substrate-binding protein
MKRVLALMLVLGMVLAACGSDDAGDGTQESCAKEDLNLVTDGQLTFATSDPAFPPWIIDNDPTNKQGFEGAVAYAVADALGFADGEVTWVRADFFEAVSVGPKDFDLNIQQYSITADRDEVVDFTAPYYVTAQALVGVEDSAVTEATSLSDLKGYNLGAQIGTTSFDYIEEVIAPDTPASAYDTNVDAKSALDAKQIDAIVFDLPTAFFVTAVELEGVSVIGVLPASEDQADRFGMLMEDGNPLKTCVDEVINDLSADGTLEALADEWLAQASDIPVLSR